MKIKEIRAISGLSQPQFSEKYGIPLSTLRNWECGSRACPKYVLDLLEYKVKNNYHNDGEKTVYYSDQYPFFSIAIGSCRVGYSILKEPRFRNYIDTTHIVETSNGTGRISWLDADGAVLATHAGSLSEDLYPRIGKIIIESRR